MEPVQVTPEPEFLAEEAAGGLSLGVLILLAVVIYLVFAAAYYLPLFIKHRRLTKEKGSLYVGAFFLGEAAVVAAILIQTGFSRVKPLQLPTGAAGIIAGYFWIMLSVAVTEELLKFFAGRIVIRKVPDLNEAGCMMLFGTVGLGFETLETLATGLTSPLGVLLRCVTALHIVLQLYMGRIWWRALQARKAGNIPLFLKERRKALLIPILIHTTFDYPVLKMSQMVDSSDLSLTAALLAVGGAVIFAIVCCVLILVSSYRALKAEKAAKAAESEAQPSPDPVTEA